MKLQDVLLALALLPTALSMAITTKSPSSVTSVTSSSSGIPSIPMPMPTALPDMPLDPNVDNLSGLERLGRALSFYSAAVPVFASYKGLETWLTFKQNILGEELSDTYVEERFDELHEWGSEVITEKIKDLKGFYVKTGQIISTRVDIFPPQYTSKLAITQDKLDPIPAHIIKDVVRRELLQGAPLDELFLEFDDIPLGSASIAQVHRAKLLDGRVVAVKVQRPGIKGKLLGDIANLKTFAKIIGESLLIDYYKIFVEMEKTLQFELDFLFEAQATAKVAAAVAHSPSNKPQTPSVTVPLAIPGLVSTRVMVMEYVDGVALSQMAKEMSDRGVVSGSPESLLLGRKLLSSLTDAYASMIFGSGIIHGDPHPGNIFILDGGEVALLDCGQVKQISTAQRTSLARLIILVNDWEVLDRAIRKGAGAGAGAGGGGGAWAQQAELGLLTTALADSVKSFGVFFKEGAGDECAAAVAILLFGSTDTILPGGYAGEEVSMDSPIVQVSEFPSEFILLGRATVMIKGIANRLGLTWGLSDRWAKVARLAIAATLPEETLPIWSVAKPAVITTGGGGGSRMVSGRELRFADVRAGFWGWARLLRIYLVRKGLTFADKRLPPSLNKRIIRGAARLAEYFERRTGVEAR
mmetsp:Transcript_7988/g.17889  ORF Transcript_7988/g.17889 Transcript_7988/m.17889 type:complete len:639 (+) Transcript_7988:163-2079(+)